MSSSLPVLSSTECLEKVKKIKTEMLEQAKKQSKNEEIERKVQEFKPIFKHKLRKHKHETQKCEKRKNEKKKSKNKKQKHNTEDESDNGSNSSNFSDSDGCKSSRSKIKKIKKEKKSRNRNNSTLRSSSNDSRIKEEVEWMESNGSNPTLKRDAWMTESVLFKTYTKQHIDKKEQQKFEEYNPAKSNRELNLYWKKTGTGLPNFQKPFIDDNEETNSKSKIELSAKYNCSKSWKKRTDSVNTKSSETLSSVITEQKFGGNSYLTDQQMNELGAKIVKAEILGNLELTEKLKKQLENARQQRSATKKDREKYNLNNKEKQVILTQTNETGNCRPLPQPSTRDYRNLYGTSKDRKNQKFKNIETHKDGQRMRYFIDDDKYNLQQMFQNEKYTSVAESALDYASIACKNNNSRDDLDDVFTEFTNKEDPTNIERKALQRAIKDQQRLDKILDDCNKCLDSSKIQKELIISVGQNVYLALPWHIGFQTGHCLIVPIQHITCSTQLDENAWIEMTSYRKALTQMFAAQNKDVIFYEIANCLRKKRHMLIHCIPINRNDSEMAPFYFKKALEESEREWYINKQLISLRDESLPNCVPKGLPYFWVNFGMENGFAHIIEDEDRFPVTFAEEIIGGMLHLEANKWRKRSKEQNTNFEVKLFNEWWKKYCPA